MVIRNPVSRKENGVLFLQLYAVSKDEKSLMRKNINYIDELFTNLWTSRNAVVMWTNKIFRGVK